jgi:16S rRNA (guanine527-N7)-methyltransferase
MGVRLDEGALDRFRVYERELRKWSERVRLVSRGDRDRLAERHFIPSLAVVPHLPLGPHALVDIGTGAGLPGIPIKIARPDIEVCLIESARMKALFLKAACAELGLDGLRVAHARAESLADKPEHRGRYQRAIARAVAALPDLWRYAGPLLAQDGHLLAVKGPDAIQELGPEFPPGIQVLEMPLACPTQEAERVLVSVSRKDTG